jgi:hypothetical protein
MLQNHIFRQSLIIIINSAFRRQQFSVKLQKPLIMSFRPESRNPGLKQFPHHVIPAGEPESRAKTILFFFLDFVSSF